jgi:hypothetical protein
MLLMALVLVSHQFHWPVKTKLFLFIPLLLCNLSTSVLDSACKDLSLFYIRGQSPGGFVYENPTQIV